jgi:hypothetical protein
VSINPLKNRTKQLDEIQVNCREFGVNYLGTTKGEQEQDRELSPENEREQKVGAFIISEALPPKCSSRHTIIGDAWVSSAGPPTFSSLPSRLSTRLLPMPATIQQHRPRTCWSRLTSLVLKLQTFNYWVFFDAGALDG